MNPARNAAAATPAPDADPPRPGDDDVNVTTPPASLLCNSLGHRQDGLRADVLVTFGTFGSHLRHDAFWPEVWGRTYPFCHECWQATLDAITHARPRLAIREVPTL